MEKLEIEEMMKWENEFFKRQFSAIHPTDANKVEYWAPKDGIPYKADLLTYSYYIYGESNLANNVSRRLNQVDDQLVDHDILFLGTPWTLKKIEGGWNLSARFRCFNSDKREWNNEPENYVVTKVDHSVDIIRYHLSALDGLSFISDMETTEKLGIPKKLLEG